MDRYTKALEKEGILTQVRDIEGNGGDNPLWALRRAWCGRHYVPGTFYARRYAAHKYAWAVPDEGALRYLAGVGPLVEVGAGTGYWASLISKRGGDIVASDKTPSCESFTEVLQADAAAFAAAHADRTLLMVWPPFAETMAAEALAAYRAAGGKRLIYVGENDGGCTGDGAFHASLPGTCVDRVIPQWDGLNDYMSTYEL